MNISFIGKWPVDGNQIRNTGEFIKVDRNNLLRTIHGKEYPVPINFFISNDLLHMGEIIVPCGGIGARASEPDNHNGDAVMYVESGPIVFFLPDSNETYVVEEGEAMFIPEGTKYQCINYTKNIIKCIFVVAPGI